jgi:hypothetical protein
MENISFNNLEEFAFPNNNASSFTIVVVGLSSTSRFSTTRLGPKHN